MPRTYVDQQLEHLQSLEGAVTLQDLSIIRCTFLGCQLWSLNDATQRARVRNVLLSECKVIGESSKLRGVVIEDCTVEDLATVGLHLDGCVFKHVVLRGVIGRVMLTNSPVDIWIPKETVQAMVEANARYYQDVDWALDISEAMPVELTLRGIPGRLIRRNPETQVLVERGKLLASDWTTLDLQGTVRSWVSYLLQMGWEDGVFVVPPRSRHRAAMMRSILTLRQAGIAEPD